MKIFAAFPSKYLKAADLQGQQVAAVMSHVMREEIENKDGVELLPVLYFNGVPKGLILNRTNATTIADAYGDETDHWGGKPIILFSAMVAFGAQTVEGVRMKAPPPRQGGPTARDRQQAFINSQADPALAAERMAEDWGNAQADRMLKGLRHDTDGVIWDEAEERPATEAETAELQNSMLRANAALETRRVLREVPKATDGLDIPSQFRREKPVSEKIGRPTLTDMLAAR